MPSFAATRALTAGRVAQRPAPRASVAVRAHKEEVPRRAALSMIAGGALLAATNPSEAAYGDAANIFGKTTNVTGFIPYAGDGYALLLPAKWNPSKEQEFEGIQLRYEDNGDTVNNLMVITKKTDKKSITDFGSPEEFLKKNGYLFGAQVFSGETISEGGFAPNRVSAASILDASTTTDKKGKTYYQYDVLTRAADGDEGGRHQLIRATTSNGRLFLLKVQIGDKRWFKGADKFGIGVAESFTVA